MVITALTIVIRRQNAVKAGLASQAADRQALKESALKLEIAVEEGVKLDDLRSLGQVLRLTFEERPSLNPYKAQVEEIRADVSATSYFWNLLARTRLAPEEGLYVSPAPAPSIPTVTGLALGTTGNSVFRTFRLLVFDCGKPWRRPN